MVIVSKVPIRFDGCNVVLLRTHDNNAWYNKGEFHRNTSPAVETIAKGEYKFVRLK